MNYRHAFHAGNPADVFKHAALSFVLERLAEKPQPFAVLDTHAGIGVYDLGSDEARRSPEWREGIGRVIGPGLESAPAYVELVRAMNPEGLRLYPGSPEIVRRMLRDGDRLIACELHPQDHAALKARYRGARGVAVHHRDGYEAIGALTPPPERRGLVLIDPPFERTDETARLTRALQKGLARWPGGTFMAWYPAKEPAVGEALARAAAAGPFPKTLRAELFPYAPGEASLPGSGLLVCNAPFRLDARLQALCAELAGRLGEGRGRWAVDWITAP